MRILIAEDEITIVKALKVMLEKNKYAVDIVHNGLDAVDYITNGHYDVIVLDIMMPAIATSADVLAMTYEDDEWVHNIQFQSARLSKLISGLITLSRIEDHIMLVGERTSIQQMISILLDNALKYADENGQIYFELRRRRNKIEIEVSNTFTPDKAYPLDISRLFERFYKADPARSRKTGGSGIGLSIAKATILAHGGTISAKQTTDSIVILASFY